MKISKGNEENYRKWYNINSDPYSRACFDYAERWAELMEQEIVKSSKSALEVIIHNAERLGKEADIEGITGFMYGSAVNILIQSWAYGEEFKVWRSQCQY